MPSDLAVFFAWNHENAAFAGFGRDRGGVAFIAILIQPDSQEIQPGARRAADPCAVLADSPSEDKQVESQKNGRKRGYGLLDGSAENFNCHTGRCASTIR
jgi:hypothetical protein